MKLLNFPEPELKNTLFLKVLILFVFTVFFFFFYFIIKYYNQGFFTYVLDDTYIHLSLARNLIDNFTWGINPHVFGSSSSSPLYTLILSFFYLIFPEHHLYPLIINYLAGSVFLLIFFNFLRTFFTKFKSLFLLLFISFVLPLLPLAFTGMEHIIHLLIIFLFIQEFVKNKNNSELPKIDDSDKQINYNSQPINGKLLFLSFISTGLRYESLFFTFIFSLLLIIKYKKFKYSLYFISSLTIPIIYGIISVYKGWYFLPSSILIKSTLFSNHPDISFFSRAFIKLFKNPVLSSLFFLNSMVVFKNYLQRSFFSDNNIISLLFIGNLLTHLQFAQTGWFYRYEAYLVIMGITAVILHLDVLKINHSLQEKITTSIITIFLLLTLMIRGGLSHTEVKTASHNIFSQQIQISHYLEKFYPYTKVGLNDIGAPSFFSNTEIYDLWGIGSFEISKEKIQGNFKQETIKKFLLSKQIPVLIVFREWFQPYGGIPHPYRSFAKLEITNNLICGSSAVYFYSSNRSIAAKIKKSLIAFQSEIKGSGKIVFFNNPN
ncbi:MAG: hypothetical protein ACQES9_02135 [Myxococcota bacterium]